MRFAVIALAALLLPVAFPAAPAALDAHLIPVRVGPVVDLARLAPADLLGPEALAEFPEAADGLFTGTLAVTGARLHLVWTEEIALGLLNVNGDLVWVTVVDGVIVPFTPAAVAEDEGFGEDEIKAPVTVPQPFVPVAARDGKLQVDFEADRALVLAFGGSTANAAQHMARVGLLTGAIFSGQLGVDFQVMHLWAWTRADPYGSASTGSSFLRATRDYWEAVRPTTSSDREVMHTFTGHDYAGVNGVAYLRQLETTWAYGIHETRRPVAGVSLATNEMAREVVTTTHEIGHNFNGRHEWATPTPGSVYDVYGPSCQYGRYGTILFPCGVESRATAFSDTRYFASTFDALDVASNGGNAPNMQAYARTRI